MQADPQKLELRTDLPPRLPGPGGIGGIGSLGALGGPLPPTHDLTRPGSLFAAASMCIYFVYLCIPAKKKNLSMHTRGLILFFICDYYYKL